ncbi:chemotaxis protein CheW [Uliginosibacterium gangwonense]|uniref:chemotaxis protein CheW n=1 Tax=Uliginosibacterium gangwonense TaxID=392736 RepID=UPI00036F9D5F|nr:chemotaxis protein CheW [Uliginosibacterium gangwonense]
MKDIDLSQFHQAFFDETQEHLEEMEHILLSADLTAPSSDDLNAIFRAAHSIKGGAGTFGFSDMADLTHVLESLLDQVRNHEIALNNEIVEACLHAGDVIGKQLQGHRDGVEVPTEDAQAIKLTLSALLQSRGTFSVEPNPVPDDACIQADGTRSWLLRCDFKGLSTEVQEALRSELEYLGSIKDLEPAGDAPATEHCFELHGHATRQEIEGIFAFIMQPERYDIRAIQPSAEQSLSPAPAISSLQTASAPEDEGFGFFTDPAPPAPNSSGDEQGYGFFTSPTAHTPTGLGTDPAPSPATLTPAAKEPPTRRTADKDNESSIRVNIEKVDQLINLVGELVITQAMLAQTVSELDPVQNEKLFNGMVQLERDSRNLQEAVMSIRMLPISFVFSRFPRMVRDLANKFGKQVELRLVGEHTELDKGVIEKLADPLTHLVRNSLDHGIETPEVRTAAGKNAKGTLTLEASQQGGNIIVEVIDDGAGLDRARIIAKARERGIAIADDAADHDVWQLIFAPGFSTAAIVTDISGRGVGMDVVKRNIESMGGRVELNSAPGFGTRITIRLPLTLAILDGMYIGVGTQVFILPLNLIVESLQPQASEISTISGKGRVIHVRGEYLPLLALYEIFKIQPQTTDPTQGIVIILELEDGRAALFVDQLLGQHQVVIKSLETNYRKVPGASGATIMGDGRVAFILDIPSLIQLGRR